MIRSSSSSFLLLLSHNKQQRQQSVLFFSVKPRRRQQQQRWSSTTSCSVAIVPSIRRILSVVNIIDSITAYLFHRQHQRTMKTRCKTNNIQTILKSSIITATSSSSLPLYVTRTSTTRRVLSTSSSSSRTTRTNNNNTNTKEISDYITSEILQYNRGIPIEQSYSLPSTWYCNEDIYQIEKDAIFLNNDDNNNWVAVDILDKHLQPGSYKTGIFLGQPYLITVNTEGIIQGFYNICTHMGSCLVGPWTKSSKDNKNNQSCIRLDSILVGKSTTGCLFDNNDNSTTKRRSNAVFQCPYHGWEYNIDGRLVKAPYIKGIQNFITKEYSLKSIPIKMIGSIVFMNFASTSKSTSSLSHEDDNNKKDIENDDTNNVCSSSDDYTSNNDRNNNNNNKIGFDESKGLLFDQMCMNGFNHNDDLSNLRLIQTKEFIVQCNWKVFCDNYGDGCYHCSLAHNDLVSNIDESNYTTKVLSNILSIQQAPPSVSNNTDRSDQRFGNKTAIYAQWYPNIMMNRYGPWFDIDIIIPLSVSTTRIIKVWFIEKDFILPNSKSSESLSSYIESSIKCSEQVHNEDVFLCENIQIGLQCGTNGYYRGRYVPTKQIATYHFHQQVASQLQKYILLYNNNTNNK